MNYELSKKDLGRLRVKTPSGDIEPMDTAWNDVFLKAMDRDKWKEWTARYASRWNTEV